MLTASALRSETGKVTGILGRNGSGKSCMFRAVMGSLKTQDLFVRVDDVILTGSMKMGKYIKYLAQKTFLLPNLMMNRGEREKCRKGIIISDHNYEALLKVSDEVLLLSDGYVHLIKDRSDLVRYGYCRG